LAKIYYAKTHEYLKEEDGVYTIGISEYAANELGDVTFVELPEIGKKFSRGEVLATIESVKAIGECYAPVDVEVISVNNELRTKPELINHDPLGAGYIAQVSVLDLTQLGALMSAEEYEKMEK